MKYYQFPLQIKQNVPLLLFPVLMGPTKFLFTPMLSYLTMEKWPGSHRRSTSLPAKLKSGISPLISKTAPSSSVRGLTTTQKSISSSSAITPHVMILNQAASGTSSRCREGRTKIQMISDTWILPMTSSLRGSLCSTPSI